MVDKFRETYELQLQAKKENGDRVKGLLDRVRSLEESSWDRPDAIMSMTECQLVVSMLLKTQCWLIPLDNAISYVARRLHWLTSKNMGCLCLVVLGGCTSMEHLR